jgi:hypothetical protein
MHAKGFVQENEALGVFPVMSDAVGITMRAQLKCMTRVRAPKRGWTIKLA